MFSPHTESPLLSACTHGSCLCACTLIMWVAHSDCRKGPVPMRTPSLHWLPMCGGPGTWKVRVAQSCLTLYNPMDDTVHGILQARILEWVAFPFTRGSSKPRDRTQVSRIAGGFFTREFFTREAPGTRKGSIKGKGMSAAVCN